MPILLRDYETKSQLNLKVVGVWQYTTHPSTDVWCCAYAIDDDPIQLWVPGDPVPAEFVRRIDAGLPGAPTVIAAPPSAARFSPASS